MKRDCILFFLFFFWVYWASDYTSFSVDSFYFILLDFIFFGFL